ncbi:Chromosome partition protein Smc [Carpediemonas membranifera]|uniref:Chromosome partition protein Smc n=1 Tax=Carpediemonas membranifera TaxID=201153 RepID=A0A8J6B655_9EUKA|nr:Chromosome partition protein Smc [Carpediemonas membranifera]|eukprot:KAG9390822.1 Chromosome partition protein Smc [Carpediemonas membranifera]
MDIDVDQLPDDPVVLKETIETLILDREDAQLEKEETELVIDELRLTIGQMEQEKNEYLSQLENAKEKLLERDESISLLQAQLESLEEHGDIIASLTQANEDLRAENETLKAQLDELEELNALNAELDEETVRTESALRKQLAALAAERDGLQHALVEAEEERDTAVEQIDAMDVELEGAQEKILDLEGTIADLTADDTEQTILVLKDQITALEHRLEAMDALRFDALLQHALANAHEATAAVCTAAVDSDTPLRCGEAVRAVGLVAALASCTDLCPVDSDIAWALVALLGAVGAATAAALWARTGRAAEAAFPASIRSDIVGLIADRPQTVAAMDGLVERLMKATQKLPRAPLTRVPFADIPATLLKIVLPQHVSIPNTNLAQVSSEELEKLWEALKAVKAGSEGAEIRIESVLSNLTESDDTTEIGAICTVLEAKTRVSIELERLRDECGSLRSRLDSASSENSKIRATITDLEIQNADLRRELGTMESNTKAASDMHNKTVSGLTDLLRAEEETSATLRQKLTKTQKQYRNALSASISQLKPRSRPQEAKSAGVEGSKSAMVSRGGSPPSEPTAVQDSAQSEAQSPALPPRSMRPLSRKTHATPDMNVAPFLKEVLRQRQETRLSTISPLFSLAPSAGMASKVYTNARTALGQGLWDAAWIGRG